MISHVVQLVPAPGRGDRLMRMIEAEVIPIIREYPGFIDELVLVPDNPGLKILAISFWNTRTDSENFTLNGFVQIAELAKEQVAAPPTRYEYTVEVSTNRKILAEGRYPAKTTSVATVRRDSRINVSDVIAAMVNPFAVMRLSREILNLMSRSVVLGTSSGTRNSSQD